MQPLLFTHPDCERHELARHPERPERLRAVMDRLISTGLTESFHVTLADEIEDADILVHTPEHVNAIVAAEPSTQVIRLDPDTYMSPGSLRASRLAAGACRQAVLDVLGGSANRAFCAVRPPGHHAFRDMAGGFCYLNNSAAAAQVFRGAFGKVAIVDVDVHHGNGTQDIFYERNDVLTIAYRNQNDSVSVAAAVVSDSSRVEGLEMVEMISVNGEIVHTGNSGGGVFVDGQLVANMWATVLTQKTSSSEMNHSSKSRAAILPMAF